MEGEGDICASSSHPQPGSGPRVPLIRGFPTHLGNQEKVVPLLGPPELWPIVRQKLLLAAAVLLIAGNGRCLAQSPVIDLGEASLEELMKVQVYRASKHLQNASDAPSSVTVITSDEIQKHGYRTLADILGAVRGFYMSSDRSYTFAGVRGFGPPGDFNTRILLLVDGHRINDNIYDQAMLGTEFPVDIDLIDRVEVVRGPSSSLYGSNAFFGVIAVITKRARDINGWEFSFEPASFETYKGRATYGSNAKGLEMLFSGTFYNSAGQNLYFPEFDSPLTNYGIARNLDYDRHHDTLFKLAYRGFTLQGVETWRNKGLPTASFATEFNDFRSRNADQHQYLDLSYSSTLHKTWRMTARSYYDRYAYDGIWPYSAGQTNIDYTRGQRWGGELQVGHRMLRKHDLTVGSEVRYNLQQDQKNYDTNPPTLYVDDHRTTWMGASFVQDEFTIAPQLKFNIGVRYDFYQRYGASANPRAGLIYRPREKTTFKLLYGTAFRSPNVYEAYYGTGSGGNAGYSLNPDLRPESMRSVEAMCEQQVGRHVRLSGTVFWNYLRDLISLQQDESSQLLIFRNVDKVHAVGSELEVSAQYANGLAGNMSYTYTEAEDQRSKQLLVNSPQHLGKLNVTVPLFRRRWFASADAQYESSRETLQGNQTGAHPLFNVTLLGRAINKRLDLSTSVYNLLGRRYFAPGSGDLTQDALEQDGRTFRIKLTWHWGARH
jgi:outer membrane receptor for ferrienterochelin and colicins